MSIEGVESFVIIQGGCKRGIWCYFIYEAVKRFLTKNKNRFKPEELLLIFDNAKAHV